MGKSLIRILLEIFSRNIIIISSVYFLAINISNKTEDIRIRLFCTMAGIILIWWTLLPAWDEIKDWRSHSHKT